MRGPRHIRHQTVDHLKTWLNPTVARIGAEAGVDLPEIAEWHDEWNPAEYIEAWPVLMMTAQGGINRGRIDFLQGQPVHQWDWTVRAWLWARGETYEQTADFIELLATAVVETLTARPGLTDATDRMRVITEGDQPFRMSLSDVENFEGERHSIAGAYIEFVVTMAEIATLDPLGTAETIALTVGPKEP